MTEPFPRASPGVPPVAMALRFGAGPAKAAPTRRSVRCFGEMAPPFPRAGPGVPPVAIALRFGAGPAKAAPTRRSVRRIFPAARVAGKNDSDSFRRWRRKPGRGFPFLDFSPRDGGRESPVGCLLLLEESAIRLAAGRLWRWGFGVNFADFRADFAGFGAKKWFSSRPPAAIPGAKARRRGGILKPPRYWGISPAGSSAGAVPFFPAAPEIGDKLWNRSPQRNRPLSSSRAS